MQKTLGGVQYSYTSPRDERAHAQVYVQLVAQGEQVTSSKTLARAVHLRVDTTLEFLCAQRRKQTGGLQLLLQRRAVPAGMGVCVLEQEYATRDSPSPRPLQRVS